MSSLRVRDTAAIFQGGLFTKKRNFNSFDCQAIEGAKAFDRTAFDISGDGRTEEPVSDAQDGS